MKTSDKLIICFYVILGLSFLASFVFFADFSSNNSTNKQTLSDEIILTQTIPLNKTSVFITMTDVEKYPLVLPKNILSVKILNQSNNVIYAEEDLYENFLHEKFTIKHTFYKYDNHTIEFLDGSAKGTTINQTFEGNDDTITLTTKIKLNFSDWLEDYIQFIPRNLAIKALNNYLEQFLVYSKTVSGNNSFVDLNPETVLFVDDLYRELLLRPADREAFVYWGNLLESGKLTKEQIRTEIKNSQEYLSMNP